MRHHRYNGRWAWLPTTTRTPGSYWTLIGTSFFVSTDVDYYLDSKPVMNDEIAVEIINDRSIALPKLGRRTRSAPVCQPPLKSIEVTANRCFPTPNGQRPLQSITLPPANRVTLGNIVDAARILRHAHRNCVDAEEWQQHMRDASVPVGVAGRGVL